MVVDLMVDLMVVDLMAESKQAANNLAEEASNLAESKQAANNLAESKQVENK